MNSTLKTVVFWLVILISAFLLWKVAQAPGSQSQRREISYSEFLSQVEAGTVMKVTISQNEVHGVSHDGSSFRVTAPPNQENMLQSLRQNKVEVWYRGTASTYQMLGTWAPLIILAGLWFYMIRRLQTKRIAEQNDPSPGATRI